MAPIQRPRVGEQRGNENAKGAEGGAEGTQAAVFSRGALPPIYGGSDQQGQGKGDNPNRDLVQSLAEANTGEIRGASQKIVQKQAAARTRAIHQQGSEFELYGSNAQPVVYGRETKADQWRRSFVPRATSPRAEFSSMSGHRIVMDATDQPFKPHVPYNAQNTTLSRDEYAQMQAETQMARFNPGPLAWATRGSAMAIRV